MTHKYRGKQKTDFIDDQCSFLFRIFIDQLNSWIWIIKYGNARFRRVPLTFLWLIKYELRVIWAFPLHEKIKKLLELNTFKSKKQYLAHFWSNKSFKGTVVNLKLPSLSRSPLSVISPFNKTKLFLFHLQDLYHSKFKA